MWLRFGSIGYKIEFKVFKIDLCSDNDILNTDDTDY